jgi:hypothetical protein
LAQSAVIAGNVERAAFRQRQQSTIIETNAKLSAREHAERLPLKERIVNLQEARASTGGLGRGPTLQGKNFPNFLSRKGRGHRNPDGAKKQALAKNAHS